MQEVIIVECKNCHGGLAGEKASCMEDIISIVNEGNIAFMMHSYHVKDKLDEFGSKYEVRVSYEGINNDIPIGMWISKGKSYNNQGRKLRLVK